MNPSSFSTVTTMEKLPDSVLLEILRRLDKSADVARSRVAWKAFDTVSPGVRSISLRSSEEWYSRVSNSEQQPVIQPLPTVFLHLISYLETVESVRLVLLRNYGCKGDVDDDGALTEGDFPKQWLPKLSRSLKSLQICDVLKGPFNTSNILLHISAYCHNLVKLRLDCVWLSLHNLIPMPMLTKLTLGSIIFGFDEYLTELNTCFPNLQFFELFAVGGIEHLMINHLKLKTFVWDNCEDGDCVPSLTLITPNLTTLKVDSSKLALIHVEAPMLSHFKLCLNGREHACVLTCKKFENLKTLSLRSSFIGSLLSQFPILNTVENLTLHSEDDFPDSEDLTSDSENDAPRDATDSEENLISDSENDAPRDASDSEENLIADAENDAPRDATDLEENAVSDSEKDTPRDASDSELTLAKVFRVFPNVRSLCINSEVWSELEFGWNKQGWGISDGGNGWKAICAYMKVIDPLAYCFLSSLLDEFVNLSEVSLLIHDDVVATVAESFMCSCMARWPGIKWKWGIWGECVKDRWIIDDRYIIKPHKSSKKRHL